MSTRRQFQSYDVDYVIAFDDAAQGKKGKIASQVDMVRFRILPTSTLCAFPHCSRVRA